MRAAGAKAPAERSFGQAPQGTWLLEEANMRMHRSILSGLAMGALLAGLALAGAAAAASVSDAWITTKLKASLVAAPDVSAIDVDVDTRGGRVTLHGMASTEAERMRAEAIARQVDGVREVRNLLQVVPEDRRAQVSANDRELKRRVEQALRGDRSLEGITVRSVSLGVVLLGGEAGSVSDHLRALEVTRGVEGVRGVESEIESPDRLADAEIWREPDVAAEQDSVRSLARDLWITSAARVKLLAAGASAFNVSVDTRGGVVTLFGTVDSEGEKTAAADAIQTIDGVLAVRNELQVVPTARRDETRRADERIQQDVQRRLGGQQDLQDADIDVEVHDGVVRLTGSVTSQNDRLAALTTARSGAGVRSVVGDLRVERD